MTQHGKRLDRVTLEMSLKPFTCLERSFIEEVWREVFRQWMPLCRMAEKTAVLFWTGDGQEICLWRGCPDDEIEWARYIGFCNPGMGLYQPGHAESQPVKEYRENPVKLTYSGLREIVRGLRTVAGELKLDLEVGTTFDPGPEFVRDDFRYRDHPELLGGGPGVFPGTVTMLDCASSLQADSRALAGFPQGIPEGTSFGAFLGRQCRSFMSAMGFDYLWLSNGLGYSYTSWYYLGVNFDGREFGRTDFGANAAAVRNYHLDFRRECPDLPVEVRGHNFALGMGMAMYAMLPQDVYEAGRIDMPSPNPPWGSYDPGIETAAMMSSIAHLPGEHYLCRLYINDPWFYTNPWTDYYNREPYDIYMPLSVSRLDESGQAVPPDRLALLTIDTELGELRQDPSRESFVHMRRGLEDAPDAPGICTWLYPYEEMHQLARRHPGEIGRAYFTDTFIADAVNNGFPLNTVVSTGNFARIMEQDAGLMPETIITAPTPFPGGGDYEKLLLQWLDRGGRLLLYGPLDVASAALRGRLGIDLTASAEGELPVVTCLPGDNYEVPERSCRIFHHPALSGGRLCEVSTGDGVVVTAGNHAYAVVTGGQLAWLRGSIATADRFSQYPITASGHPDRGCTASSLWLRELLAGFGYLCRQFLYDASSLPVVQTISRHDNGYFFSGYKPDATVQAGYRFPDGIPLFTERETRITAGLGRYSLDRSFHLEARVFVDQPGPQLLACKERQHPTGTSRQMMISGLKDARVVIYPSVEAVRSGSVSLILNEEPQRAGDGYRLDTARNCLEIAGVSGFMEVNW